MRKDFTRPAWRVAITYVVIASLWILFSDRFVAMVFGGTGWIGPAQTIKGWLFVLLTGMLLYGLMRRTLNRIRTIAFEDPLCGLPNRLAFVDELQRRCKRGSARSHAFSLTILDMDRFTDLNDEWGHAQGDLVLQMLGRELTRRLGEQWYVARLGGDEFGLISPAHADPAETLATLNDIQRSVTRDSTSSLLNDQRISAGTSNFPDHGRSRHDLLRHADMALALAKELGRNQHVVYHEQLKRNLIARVSLLKDLRAACDENAFSVVYQPQWSVAEQRWIGAEVLVRWEHPERGLVPPDIFIPMAEREGLITPITEFVVRQALSELQAVGIRRENLPCLSVNLSHPVLVNEATMNQLFTLIQQLGEACPRVVMEITETAAMEDLDATLAAMRQWRRESFNFSIDDFGTGYSSLARLKQMPISELKIDRSFIQGVPHDQNDAVIIKAILAMAHTLSLQVVAEGVETEQQARFLTEHGCTTFQGFLYGRPMPIGELRRLLL